MLDPASFREESNIGVSLTLMKMIYFSFLKDVLPLAWSILTYPPKVVSCNCKLHIFLVNLLSCSEVQEAVVICRAR
jgi:hypothetical protein